MKEEGDVFRKFQESIRKINGHFHVLEQRVPLIKQLEYFKYTEQVRDQGKNLVIDESDYENFRKDLSDPELALDCKRTILSLLAISQKVESYRMLEDYAQHPEEDLKDWAYMALIDSRIALESDLLDEKHVYISTGLGGKEDKLRFYILLISKNLEPFEEFQHEVIKREFAFSFDKNDSEIERLTVTDNYVEMVCLIPMTSNIKLIIEQVINECNLYGDFLSENFTLTNVKEMSKEEIAKLITEYANNQAGN